MIDWFELNCESAVMTKQEYKDLCERLRKVCEEVYWEREWTKPINNVNADKNNNDNIPGVKND